MMVSAPLSHVQGLLLGLCVPLHVGLSIIHTPFSHPGHLLRTIRDNRVIFFSSVPRVLQVMARALLNRPYGWSRAPLREWLASSDNRFLRRHRIFNTIRPVSGYLFWVVVVGGATLPRDVEIFWRNTGCLMVQGYGLTETAAVISINLPVFGKFGSIGKPLGGQEVRLAEDGEIQVRGPNVTAGYFGGGGAELFTADGYLKTGDLGRLEGDRLFFEGRKKEVIVTGEGFNVYCEDVERALDAQPGVRAALAMGLEREDVPEVHAVLLLQGGAQAEAVVRGANAVLQPHERIRGWTVWPEEDFPRGALQKIHRHLVVERAAHLTGAAAISSTAPVTLEAITGTRDRVERLQLLARYLANAPPESLAGERARLSEELGLSSLDIAELLFLLEARSPHVAPQLVLEEGASVADLHALLTRPEQAPPVRAIHARHPPRWAALRPLELVRRVLSPLVLRPWTAMRVKLEVQGREHLEGVRGPIVLATTGHEHASDLLAIHAALPRRLRRRLAFVASRWVFGHYLEPTPEATALERAGVAVAFHLAIPLFFPFALTPHSGTTREGLLEACRLIDRGYSLVMFGGQAHELISAQTGAPVVPVHLSGNEDARFLPRWPRPRVQVSFSAPVRP
jgi:long-chain acyl-CoA synthetase